MSNAQICSWPMGQLFLCIWENLHLASARAPLMLMPGFVAALDPQRCLQQGPCLHSNLAAAGHSEAVFRAQPGVRMGGSSAWTQQALPLCTQNNSATNRKVSPNNQSRTYASEKKLNPG